MSDHADLLAHLAAARTSADALEQERVRLESDVAALQVAVADATRERDEALARVAVLEAQLAPAPAVVQGTLHGDATMAGGIRWLGNHLGRPLEPGETARLWIQARPYPQLVLDSAGHEWWARGTLELAGIGGQVGTLRPTTAAHREAISIQSSAPTGGTCRLVLRNVAVEGSIVISCPGGIAVSMLGSSSVSSVPRPAAPEPV